MVPSLLPELPSSDESQDGHGTAQRQDVSTSTAGMREAPGTASEQQHQDQRGTVVTMSPLDICFSQWKVRHTFWDGTPLEQVLPQVRAVPSTAEDRANHNAPWRLEAPFEAIEIVLWRCKLRDATTGRPKIDPKTGKPLFDPDFRWFTLDNRRLYCLQKAAMSVWPERCVVDVVEVPRGPPERVRELRKFRTLDSGQSIMIGSTQDKVPFQGWSWEEQAAAMEAQRTGGVGGGGSRAASAPTFVDAPASLASSQSPVVVPEVVPSSRPPQAQPASRGSRPIASQSPNQALPSPSMAPPSSPPLPISLLQTSSRHHTNVTRGEPPSGFGGGAWCGSSALAGDANAGASLLKILKTGPVSHGSPVQANGPTSFGHIRSPEILPVGQRTEAADVAGFIPNAVGRGGYQRHQQASGRVGDPASGSGGSGVGVGCIGYDGPFADEVSLGPEAWHQQSWWHTWPAGRNIMRMPMASGAAATSSLGGGSQWHGAERSYTWQTNDELDRVEFSNHCW
eukprot:TRINITY_DN33839_c0_g1_i1.p1 TRINITY_DN33839_c0_g1~~TRINITY_DN33839_c0_g1_i1.p1  ORF type:complete len:537 (+),score=78.73 TRINITY_DN33839_c0_g1_i1:86-1612(+)